MADDVAVLRAIIEKALPVVLQEPRSHAMKSMWQQMQEDFAAGRAFPAAHVPYTQLETWDEFREYYDAASESAQERLWEWVLKQCDKYGAEVLADITAVAERENPYLSEEARRVWEKPPVWHYGTGGPQVSEGGDLPVSCEDVNCSCQQYKS